MLGASFACMKLGCDPRVYVCAVGLRMIASVLFCMLVCGSCWRLLVVGGAEVGFVEVSAWLWILLTSMRRLVEEGFEAGLVVDVRVLLGRGGSVA